MKPYSESYKLSHRQFLSKNYFTNFFQERSLKKNYQLNKIYKNDRINYDFPLLDESIDINNALFIKAF